MPAHIPHLLLPGPWEADRLRVSEGQRSHLEKVLRRSGSEPITYTDGEGSFGTGDYDAAEVIRGEERRVPRPTDLVVVVAPPDSRDRVRFMVEKLAELGVAELNFLATKHGRGRPPKPERLRSWAVSGLEQSAGAWLMRTPRGLISLSDLEPPYAVCDIGGSRVIPSARTVVIGPEGGWSAGEIPEEAVRYDLGETVLRVETAALVAAARMV
ncbi:MAG TPA: 16S rRNA (uracil(1498)-N(3))-methyltransferase [Acidimicrobiia bacterium]|nr:16S rRNA (uracil(1498)-N(3))-methyltransferase [Acidimicrobiia bacterium]